MVCCWTIHIFSPGVQKRQNHSPASMTWPSLYLLEVHTTTMQVHLQGGIPTGKVSQNLLSLGEGKLQVKTPSGPIKTSTHIL